MKGKRWKRRNRHTRPEWVEAYWFVDVINSHRLDGQERAYVNRNNLNWEI